LKQEKSIAQERIRKLVKRAYEVWYEDKVLSQRYIEIARNIGMHCNVRLSRTVKQYFCKKCNSILIPGTSCRVRVRPECGTKLTITCLECGTVKRFSQLKEGRKNEE